MGKKDTITKNYMKENRVFADAFNYLLYNGQQMIQPEKLREIDTIEMAILQGGDQKHQDSETVQKYRDILKKTVVKEDGETVYLLLGVENQTDIHYAMPVRNLIYDALQYGKQVSDITAENRKTGKKRSGGEYLSGFYKEDKLTPVITLVIHFGTELWDGPESLHEMLRVNDKKILDYIPDYRIHLIDPARLTKEQLELFQTSLREVLGCIKYAKDKERLKEYITENTRMYMENAAAQVIKAITNTPITISEEEEEINVCQAVDEMIEDGRAEGRAEGELFGFIKAYTGLIKDGLLSVKEAALRMHMTEEKFVEKMEKVNEKS